MLLEDSKQNEQTKDKYFILPHTYGKNKQKPKDRRQWKGRVNMVERGKAKEGKKVDGWSVHDKRMFHRKSFIWDGWDGMDHVVVRVLNKKPNKNSNNKKPQALSCNLMHISN